MERKAMVSLLKWKESKDRKPLVLKGARQVGKTWLMKEFGRRYYSDIAYLNFDKDDSIKSIFANNKDPKRIIELLSMIVNRKIEPEKTLIVFDEVQECPEALNCLKYFCEEANEYHIISAGSLLGTLPAEPKSYPVGKVNLLKIRPLDFDEYLMAADEGLYNYYSKIVKNQLIEEVFHSRLIDAYHNYLIIGGMPESVSSWIANKDPRKIKQIQSELIELYENDISKHSGKINAGRILLVLRSLPSQLARENRKFSYSAVKQGARAREFEEAIEWLVSAGLINRVRNVNKIEYPLKAYENLDSFKLYFFDTGLLTCLSEVDYASIQLETDYQFKGPLAENYILQQLIGQFDDDIRYYADKNGEIDFLVQESANIIPIEVKAGDNKKAKSFKNYINSNNPTFAIRYSKMGYKKDGLITNVPLALADKTKELI